MTDETDSYPILIEGHDWKTGEAYDHKWSKGQVPHKLIIRKLSQTFAFLIDERAQMIANFEEIAERFQATRTRIAKERNLVIDKLSDIYPTKGRGSETVSGHFHYYPDWRKGKRGMNSSEQLANRHGSGRSDPVLKRSTKKHNVKFGHYKITDFREAHSDILDWELKLIWHTEKIIQPIRASIRERNNAIQGLAYLRPMVLADEKKMQSIDLFDDRPWP